MGVGLIAVSAQISVPFYPVPMTLQTLAVLLVGGLMGSRLGVAAVGSYLLLGLAGAPVFHNGLGGLAVLCGPTGGYLLGFVPAAFLMGLASRSGRSLPQGRIGGIAKVAMLAGGVIIAEAAIYACGLPWLAVFTGKDMGAAVAAGLVPFLLGDLVKGFVAVMVIGGSKRSFSRLESLPL